VSAGEILEAFDRELVSVLRVVWARCRGGGVGADGHQVPAGAAQAAGQGTDMNAASTAVTISEGPAVERRKHRRLAIRLPVECCARGQIRGRVIRGTTANVSSGGLYFEVELDDVHRHRFLDDVLGQDRLLEVELTVPPGEGHFPYEGHVRSAVEIVRREELTAAGGEGGHRRVGLAGRFHDPLKLTF